MSKAGSTFCSWIQFARSSSYMTWFPWALSACYVCVCVCVCDNEWCDPWGHSLAISGLPTSVKVPPGGAAVGTKSPVELLAAVNAAAGKHGVGRIDIVENRFIGLKVFSAWRAKRRPAGSQSPFRPLAALLLIPPPANIASFPSNLFCWPNMH